MEGQAGPGPTCSSPRPGDRAGRAAGRAEPIVRDAYLRAAAEPKVFPAEPEAGL